jgi:peptide/nickel transport system ATP-binding protein
LELSRRRLQAIRGHKIAMVFQDPMTSLNPYLKIGVQVTEQICRHLKYSNSKARAHAISMLEAVGIPNPSERVNHYPHEYSGGMRQRSMLAIALSCGPDLLIADEPTTALDVTTQAQILNLIRNELKRREMSLLLISHDLGVVAGLCERVAVMYAGKIVEEGTVKDIYARPCHPYTRALLNAIPKLNGEKSAHFYSILGQPPDLTGLADEGCAFSPRCYFARDQCKIKSPELKIDSRGHSHRCHFELSLSEEKRNEEFKPGELERGEKQTMLSLEHVKVHYPITKRLGMRRGAAMIRAVDDVSLRLYEGEILGLAGESGCGKSTLVRAVLQLVRPSGGNVIFQGKDLTSLGGESLRRIRSNIQLIFQDPYASLNPRLTAWQNIAEPLVNFQLADRKEAVKEAERLMELVGLLPSWSMRYPHQFSGGQRQRIGIARALALKPKLILCDEPVSSLDVSIQAQILNLLKNLRRQLKLSLLFISHDLGVVRQFSDRVAIMYLGRIVECADTSRLYNTAKHPYTRSLLNAIPVPDPVLEAKRETILLSGDPPSPAEEYAGCAFAPRCPRVKERCRKETPDLKDDNDHHPVSCFYWQEHRL